MFSVRSPQLLTPSGVQSTPSGITLGLLHVKLYSEMLYLRKMISSDDNNGNLWLQISWTIAFSTIYTYRVKIDHTTIVTNSQNSNSSGLLSLNSAPKSKMFVMMYNEHTTVSVIKIALILSSARNLQAHYLKKIIYANNIYIVHYRPTYSAT